LPIPEAVPKSGQSASKPIQNAYIILQHLNMSEQELVKMCLTEVFLRNGYAEPHSLVQRDYENVSQAIEAKTGILISISTLKRLLKGDFARLPQVATLNAISRYLGYQHWQDYRSATKSKIPIAATHSPRRKFMFQRSLPKTLLYSSILSLLLVLFITSRSSLKDAGAGMEKAQFSVKKVTANDIPNTVIFSYDVADIEADSFFIQQSWDKNRRVRVYKKQHTLTDIYYEPGYHTAKLIANDVVIKTTGVSIPTKDWFFYAKRRFPHGTPSYIYPKQPIQDGELGLQASDLGQHDLNLGVENNYVYTYFPSRWPVHSDNCIFKTRVRVQELKKNPCPYLMLEVFCQQNFMYFISMPRGCTSESKLQFGDLILDGKTTDLSALGADVTTWMEVKIEVRNRLVTIYYGDKKVYTGRYSKSAGKITGIGFISNGLCKIDQVELKGLNGAVFYQNNFDQIQ
jgi:hypothetical protein